MTVEQKIAKILESEGASGVQKAIQILKSDQEPDTIQSEGYVYSPDPIIVDGEEDEVEKAAHFKDKGELASEEKRRFLVRRVRRDVNNLANTSDDRESLLESLNESLNTLGIKVS